MARKKKGTKTGERKLIEEKRKTILKDALSSVRAYMVTQEHKNAYIAGRGHSLH